MLNQQSIDLRKGKWISGSLIVIGIVLSFLVPIVAPVFSVALIAGGIYTYRRNTDKTIRSLALAAIITGAVIIVGFATFLLLTLPAHTGISGVLIGQ